MKKLFVGNIPYNATEDTLRELFSSHGDVVSAIIITDRETGRSRGFGFVEFSSEDDADSAVNSLNSHDMGGRKLVVNKARPQRER